MLRIIPQANSAAAKSYYSQGHSDYYAADLDSPGVWGGQGAKTLGLSGEIQKPDFDALCDNLDPRSGQSLTPRTRSDRTVLYDFNVHVPKSLSVLIEHSMDPKLIDAVQLAADAMMSEVEAEMQTRVRKNGQDSNRVTGNMVYAKILHRTSRPSKEDKQPDPLTHLHITVFNATFDKAEQQWKAGQFRDLVRDAPYWQAVFHSKLTAELAEMGYGVARSKTGWEVDGVPRSVNDKFSRRTAEIEKLAVDLKITDPVAKSKLGATSREKKSSESIANLREYWDGRLTDDERNRLNEVVADANSGELVPLAPTAEAAAHHAIAHMFERASVVPEKRLVAEALTYGVGGVTPKQVRSELNKQGVFTRMWEGRLVATTQGVLEEEERMLGFAREGRGRHKPLASRHTIHDERLNDDQRAAVNHILNSNDRVMMIRGAAGAGKTTLTKEAVDALENQGVPVLTIAPSADASRGTLRAEGFGNADTVARFLTNSDYREEARGGVIWVDEAGLLGAPTMAKLFDAAQELDARVVLMGDTRQHAGVERGSALRLLESHAGVPVANVRQILRQRGAYKDAVEKLAEGETKKGFEAIDTLGWVKELPDGEREQAIAEEYANAVKAKENVLVVSPTHAEAEVVTEAIRNKLKAANLIRSERTFMRLAPANLTEAQRADTVNYAAGDVLQFIGNIPGHKSGSRVNVDANARNVPLDHAARFQSFHTRELALGIGDTVRITHNGWSKDRQHRLNNGSVYRIAGFTKRGDITLDNGWTVAKEFGHLTHGYVSTSHGSQGRTVDRVLIAQSSISLPASSREQFYVSVSRGRRSVSVFTDNKTMLQEAITRSDPRLSATELLEKSERGTSGLVPIVHPHRSVVTRLKDWVAHRQRLTKIDWVREQHQPQRELDQSRGYDR